MVCRLAATLALAALWLAPAASADVTFGGCVRDDTSSAPCAATATGLDQVLPLALAGDGQLYAAALREDAVSAFNRDATGALGFIGCWQGTTLAADHCAGRRSRGLTYPTAVVVSPDGRNLYAIGQTGNALVVFARNAATGDLTLASCWTTSPPVRAGEITDCGTNVTPGLERPTGLAISPDGESVYVTAAFSSTLAIFNRDTATGALTPGPTVAGRGLLSGVTVAPDGRAVYVTSYQGAIATFERSASAGHALTARGCLGVAALGCTPQRSTAMDRASFPRVSADNRTVLVAGRGTTVFARDPATSRLTWAGCLDGPGTADCGPVTGLLGAIGVAISPDGENVYANSGGILGEPGAMVVFARDTSTGILTFVRCIKNPASTLSCDRTAPAVDGNGDVVITPRGDVVYSAAGTPGASAITWFARTRDPRPAAAAPGVSGSSITVASTSAADLPIACRPGATEFCDGTLAVDLVPKSDARTAAKPTPIGALRFKTQTRRGKATVRVKLTAAGRRALKSGNVKVRVRLTRQNPNGTTTKATKTVTLKRKR